MNDNPYAAPSATVTDFEPQGSLERPRMVVIAVRLLWTGFAISSLMSIGNLFSLPANGPVGPVVAFTLIGLAVAAAVSYWLFTAAWRGFDWARWVIASFIVLGIVLMVTVSTLLPRSASISWQAIGSFGIRMTLNSAAVVMLCSAAANAWYREKKRERRR